MLSVMGRIERACPAQEAEKIHVQKEGDVLLLAIDH